MTSVAQSPSGAARGERLFDLVRQYAAFGEHRTGTNVDHATVEWFTDQLRSAGLDVVVEDVAFEHWVGGADVRVDGAEVDCLAVPYEWSGEIDVDHVDVCSFDPMRGGFPQVLDEPIAAARDRGASVALLATDHPNGSLVGINRHLHANPSGFPTVLVAGRDAETLRTGQVNVRISGQVEPGRTANVVARNGVPGDPVMLTTPLTGWFSCAGERGTGIAVLLDLVERFADHPLLVVATSGHELGSFGAHRWVDAHTVAPAGIVHLGASVAVDAPGEMGERQLVSTRFAMTSFGAAEGALVASALEHAGLALAFSTEQWIGEGEAWSRLGVPLLSSTGAGVDFHTPEDTPERATSARSLALVADAMTEATAAFIDALGRSGAP